MKYSLIYADPAWLYDNKASNGAAEDHYDTMKLIDMKRLPVWDLAADDAVLAMWFTGTHTREAIELAEAWGFKVRTMKGFTWVKFNPLAEKHINKALQAGRVEDFYDFLDLLNAQTRMNGGNYTRANTEDLLIATREKDLNASAPASSRLSTVHSVSTARSQQRRVSVWKNFMVTFRASNYSAVVVRLAGTTGEINLNHQLLSLYRQLLFP